MCNMIFCLVDRKGKVYAKDGVHSYSHLAELSGVDENKCLKFEFRLDTRKLFQDFRGDRAPLPAKQSCAAQRFFDRCAGTSENLMAYVQRGNWDKGTLLGLLTDSAREEYVKADSASAARAKYRKACSAARAKRNEANSAARAECDKDCHAAWVEYNKFFLAFGARAKESRACFAALAEENKARFAASEKCDRVRSAAREEYDKACANIWIRIFKNPENRIKIWKK